MNLGRGRLLGCRPALRKDEFHGFKIAAGIAYGENTEGPLDAYNADQHRASSAWATTSSVCISVGTGRADTKCSQLGGSISVMHVEVRASTPTSRPASMKDDADQQDRRLPGRAIPTITSTFCAFEAGIEKKWHRTRQDHHLRPVLSQRRRIAGPHGDRRHRWLCLERCRPTRVSAGTGSKRRSSSTRRSSATASASSRGSIRPRCTSTSSTATTRATSSPPVRLANGVAGTKFDLDDLDVVDVAAPSSSSDPPLPYAETKRAAPHRAALSFAANLRFCAGQNGGKSRSQWMALLLMRICHMAQRSHLLGQSFTWA